MIGVGIDIWSSTVPGGVGPSVPIPTEGLQAWYKADGTLYQDSGRTTPATADGDPVGSVTDESGNGRHFSQATASKKPSYRVSVVNGKPVLRFDGTDDELEGPNFLTGFTAGEVFLVVKINSDPPTSGADGLWDFGSVAANTHYPFNGDGNIYDDFGTNDRKSTGNPTPSLASWRLYNVVSAASEWTSRIDGTQHFTTATNTVSWTTAPLIGGASTTHLAGDIAEFILYNAVLSSADRNLVENYIAGKYGLTIA